jgi:glycerol-3-phosphate O-acyltransferase / dihydroxyacetone phosphate acyltransferase
MLILAHCRRKLGFLIAAKSMQKKVVGFFARSLHSIPVVRALDAAKPGIGKVVIVGTKVSGDGTKFGQQLEKGFSLYVKGMEDPIRVDEIISDTECVLNVPFDCAKATDFKVVPKLDHSKVYDTVWKRLGEGGALGIFPEGGSHDRTQLLPLKAGVTLMALGAMEKYNVPITIVPCGLNYFSGHRFRSHVLVEFGKPYQIPSEFVTQWKSDKRQACKSLLEQVDNQMRNVTINAPDYDSLRAIFTIRRLYTPSTKTLTSDQYLELNRRFAQGWVAFHDRPEVQQGATRIKEYNDKLDMLGVKDYHASSVDNVSNTLTFGTALVSRFVLIVALFLLALPGLILGSPIGIIAKVISLRKAKEAKASSLVKLKGTDVIASYKLIIGLVVTPIVYWTYFLVVLWFFGFTYALLYVVAWPLLTYASVRVTEEGLTLAKSLIALVRIRWAADELTNLRNERKELQQMIRDLVERLGPQLITGFGARRIVKLEEIEKEKELEALHLESSISSPSSGLLRQRNKAYLKLHESEDSQRTLDTSDLDDLEDVFN